MGNQASKKSQRSRANSDARLSTDRAYIGQPDRGNPPANGTALTESTADGPTPASTNGSEDQGTDDASMGTNPIPTRPSMHRSSQLMSASLGSMDRKTEPILIRTDEENRRHSTISLTNYLSTSSGSVTMVNHPEKNKDFSVDEMIQRLIESGVSGKVSKSPCLKNSEITAICHAAREIF
ncbi:serine/threonine protein phosphatase Pzh1, partial [Dimargaris verticillata]